MNAEYQDRNAEFLAERPRLIGIAYRMLGSMSDAEDAVQDAFLRWQESNLVAEKPGAYLRKIVVNLCIDRLRQRRDSKVDYIGPWVPEPYYSDQGGDRPSDPEYLVGGLSTAFIMILERLTPLQRAVYLLKQVIGLSHTEIANLLDITVASSRTHQRRARQALSVDGESRFVVDPDEHRQLLERFMYAVAAGDVGGLKTLLADDVTCYTDGGGKAAAASKPFGGANAVIKFILGLTQRKTFVGVPRIVEVNGTYGIFVTDETGDSLITVGSHGGFLNEIFIQRNPDKLQGLLDAIGVSHALSN